MASCGSSHRQPFGWLLHGCYYTSLCRPPWCRRTRFHFHCQQCRSGFHFRYPARHGKCARDTMWAGFWGEEAPHVGDIPTKVMDCVVFQLKNFVTLWVSLVVLVFHALISWLFVYVLDFGVVGGAVALDISWWVLCFGLLGYVTCGWCPLSWTGFSMEAFYGLWEFVKLSIASGVMLCLEFWYYRILILMTGYLQNATLAVDALSICMTINGWELMIHLAFFAGTGVKVANELGAGNGQEAKFAAKVSAAESVWVHIHFQH